MQDDTVHKVNGASDISSPNSVGHPRDAILRGQDVVLVELQLTKFARTIGVFNSMNMQRLSK